MNAAGILNLDDLREITQYHRAADVERCLKSQGVKVFWGRKGPWTTLELVNAAGGAGKQQTESANDIEFEDE